ncbi:MAG TPA: RsmB/NOP family class I SAM-dependent RNA methyltransferase [Verrucomicrobiae bacterium]
MADDQSKRLHVPSGTSSAAEYGPRARPLALAVRIIEHASRERPADRVLRDTLKSERHLPASDSATVSRSVFAYYRWLGWLERAKPLPQQVETASALATRFAVSPDSLSDAELMQRAAPGWLGEEVQMTAEFARALQSAPPVWLRARPGQGISTANLLGECRPFGSGALAEALQYLGHKDLLSTPEFHRGLFELQDLSSQAVGLICDPKPGEVWWDTCAGEGGKLLHLSDLMQNKGLIWGSDRAAWRLKRLGRRAARAGVFNYRSAPWDGGAKLPTRTKFDGILVDAPCTGVGTWHRNPQARWTTSLEDIKELSDIQSQLLARACLALKPGGKLVYSVCTLTRSETVNVVMRFQNEFPQFEPLLIRNPCTSQSAAQQTLQIPLEVNGGNGMFVAAWRRKNG